MQNSWRVWKIKRQYSITISLVIFNLSSKVMHATTGKIKLVINNKKQIICKNILYYFNIRTRM